MRCVRMSRKSEDLERFGSSVATYPQLRGRLSYCEINDVLVGHEELPGGLDGCRRPLPVFPKAFKDKGGLSGFSFCSSRLTGIEEQDQEELQEKPRLNEDCHSRDLRPFSANRACCEGSCKAPKCFRSRFLGGGRCGDHPPRRRHQRASREREGDGGRERLWLGTLGDGFLPSLSLTSRRGAIVLRP